MGDVELVQLGALTLERKTKAAKLADEEQRYGNRSLGTWAEGYSCCEGDCHGTHSY